MINVNRSLVEAKGDRPTLRCEFIMICKFMYEEIDTIEEFIEDIEDSIKGKKEIQEENQELIRKLMSKLRGIKND